MTVICWDGQTLAADKRATTGGLAVTVTKLRRVGTKLVGVAGGFASGLAMLKWLGKKGAEFPEFDEEDWCSLLVIDKNQILVYEQTPEPYLVEDPFFAIGSGREYALAAMYCGKTAEEAVGVASQFDSCCGNGVDLLRWTK